jgi:hypothetical protein
MQWIKRSILVGWLALCISISSAKEPEAWTFELPDGCHLIVSVSETKVQGRNGYLLALRTDYSLNQKEQRIAVIQNDFMGERRFAERRALLAKSKAATSLSSERTAIATPAPFGHLTIAEITEVPAWRIAVRRSDEMTYVGSKRKMIEDPARDILFEPLHLPDATFPDARSKELWLDAAATGAASIKKFECVKDEDLEIWSLHVTVRNLEGTFQRRVGYRGWWKKEESK